MGNCVFFQPYKWSCYPILITGATLIDIHILQFPHGRRRTLWRFLGGTGKWLSMTFHLSRDAVCVFSRFWWCLNPEKLGGGFNCSCIFTPSWGNDPIWLIFFKHFQVLSPMEVPTYISCMDTAYIRESPSPKQPKIRFRKPSILGTWNSWWFWWCLNPETNAWADVNSFPRNTTEDNLLRKQNLWYIYMELNFHGIYPPCSPLLGWAFHLYWVEHSTSIGLSFQDWRGFPKPCNMKELQRSSHAGNGFKGLPKTSKHSRWEKKRVER